MIRIYATGIVVFMLSLFPVFTNAQSSFNEMRFDGVFFLTNETLMSQGVTRNEFTIKRGYITFRKDIGDRVGIRFTQDVSIDQQGDGIGDIELRLKYALVSIAFKDRDLIKDQSIELGVVSRPWIDFEQDINDYRSLRSMYLDNNNILPSADYGITYSGQLGEDIEGAEEIGIRSVPGRYGSYSIGVYNGGGYSSLEYNNNKLVEGRLSLRPLPHQLPGLQTSLIGSIGKGNIPESPDFRLGAMALSYESGVWISVLEGFMSVGDGDGQYVTPDYKSIGLKGWSIFQEFKPFPFPISILFRFDEVVDRDRKMWNIRHKMGGIAWTFPNQSKIILEYDRRSERFEEVAQHFDRIEIVTEIRF